MSATVLGDVGAWFWLILILIYVVASIVTAVRRAARQLSQRAPGAVTAEIKQAEQTPQGQRLAHAVQTIQAQAQAAAAAQAAQLQARAAAAAGTAAPGAASASTTVAAPTMTLPGAVELLSSSLGTATTRQTLLAQLGGALQRITAPVPQAPPAPPVQMAAGSLMRLAPDTSAAQSSTAPSPRFAQLATPDGFLYGIVAATVIGPPQGLRSEPMQPGGW